MQYMEYIKLNCSFCNKDFQRYLGNHNRNIKRGVTNFYCSEVCRRSAIDKRVSVVCKECGKEFKRRKSQLGRKGRSNNIFCSTHCRAVFGQKHKVTGYNRSKLEIYIEDFIKTRFPDLEFITNDRTIIERELDFYFPTINLAIEINGPTHYRPIYGNVKLATTQHNDTRKILSCRDKGILLVIIPNMESFSSELNSMICNSLERLLTRIINGG